MADTSSPITQQEMVSMFGQSMPIEAVTLLWKAPDTMTVGEIRAKLRQMVPICQSCGQYRTWCNQYDCPGAE